MSPRSALPLLRRAGVPVVLSLAVGAALTGLASASPAPAPAASSASDADVQALLAAREQAADGASRDRAAPGPTPAAPETARPSDGRLTSPFGTRWGRAHTGVDLAAGTGSPVRAAAGGTVSAVGPEGAYGTVVRVQHLGGVETVYAHLSAADVAVGTPVTAGQGLGREGSTGRSTGPHLHFEVRVGGVPVDPQAWLADRGVAL